jgi:DNA repair exonuclease SbcCD ATPase subunit
MDEKIIGLQNNYDELQVIEADIRKFSNAISDLTNKYDRIEKKTPVVEQTITGVDKSFEDLKQLEKRLSECINKVDSFPEKISTVQEDVNVLLDSRSTISEAMDKIASLTNILQETENKIEEINNTRETILKTEIRLNEASKEAQKEIKIFQDLVAVEKQKNQGKKVGAPPISVRENVIELNHKGWSEEQIANALNITLSEVQLLLDYYGKEGR